MRVDELLAAGDVGKVAGGLGCGVEAADVRHHDGGVDAPCGHELEGLLHVVDVAAGGAHDVRGVVVHVVEVDRSRELRIGGAGEEVEAAVAAEDGAGLRDDRGNGSVAEYVVVAGAAGESAQVRDGIVDRGGVDEHDLDARLGEHLLGREELGGAVEARLVDVGDHHAGGAHVAMDRIGERAEAHRARAGHDGEVAALADAHAVDVVGHRGMVGGVERADRAAHGLDERRLVVGLAVIGEEAVGVEDLHRKDAVGGVSAAELVGVAGRIHGALVVEGGLDGELLAGLVEVLVLGSHLDDIAGELVAGDDRVLGDVLGHALVLRSELRHLVRRHADRVGHDAHEHLVVLDLRELELVDAQVHRAVHPDCLGLHSGHLPVRLSVQYQLTVILIVKRVVSTGNRKVDKSKNICTNDLH